MAGEGQTMTSRSEIPEHLYELAHHHGMGLSKKAAIDELKRGLSEAYERGEVFSPAPGVLTWDLFEPCSQQVRNNSALLLPASKTSTFYRLVWPNGEEVVEARDEEHAREIMRGSLSAGAFDPVDDSGFSIELVEESEEK